VSVRLSLFFQEEFGKQSFDADKTCGNHLHENDSSCSNQSDGGQLAAVHLVALLIAVHSCFVHVRWSSTSAHPAAHQMTLLLISLQ